MAKAKAPTPPTKVKVVAKTKPAPKAMHGAQNPAKIADMKKKSGMKTSASTPAAAPKKQTTRMDGPFHTGKYKK